jgi:hypothetical protein
LIEGAQASQSAGRANPIFLEGKLLPLDAAVARALGLKEAEVVQATVQSGPGGNLVLLLRGRLIDLPQPSPWLSGQALSLKAFSTPSGGWNLQTLPNANASAPLAGSPLPAAAAGLGLAGQALPSLPPVVSDAGVFVSRAANLLFKPAGLPELAQLFQPGVLDDLLQKLPRPDLQTQWRSLQLSMAQLTPQALQRAVTAGMGAEVWLARGMSPPADDPKQVLRRLLAALTASADDEDEARISPLKRAVDEIDASRVQAVQAHAQQEVLLRMLLPFHDAEPVELVFRRAPRHGGETPPFTVNVHSRSQSLGELWLKTQLQGDRVELTMWALQADVVRKARARAPELAAQLIDAGLAMQGFQIHHGARPAEPTDFRPSGRGMVVDVSA